MEQIVNEAAMMGWYLGWVILVSVIGWGIYLFGCWLEEAIYQHYLAKTRTFTKHRGLEVWDIAPVPRQTHSSIA